MRPPLIILAGGKGTRLGNLTKDTPKPMIDIYGTPFLYWLINHYIKQGFVDITVSTGYLSEIIESAPWPWPLKFDHDAAVGDHLKNYDQEYGVGHIVVNGDTWIDQALPKQEGPWVLHHNGVDAGAHCVGFGKVDLIRTSVFYDIGTPKGLLDFKEYFRKD